MSPVIGRGGEQINKIQQESGCKVQIAPGNDCASFKLAEQFSAFFGILIFNFTILLVVKLDHVFVQTMEAFQRGVSLSQALLTPYSKCRLYR